MLFLSRFSPLVSLLFAITSAHAAGPLDGMLLQKDASGYAERMASLIDDRPECRVFKQEILAQSKNSAYAGSTMTAIGEAKRKANAAGCSSPTATGTGVYGATNKAAQAGAAAMGDAHGYAQRMAAQIADRPECAKYKTVIMAHAGGSMTSGATVGPIVQAKQDANKAGCAKL